MQGARRVISDRQLVFGGCGGWLAGDAGPERGATARSTSGGDAALLHCPWMAQALD